MYLQLNYTSSNVKVDSLTFISASKKIIKLPKYISTHIMLFHSIKQYLTRRCGSVYGRGWTNRMFEVCYVYEGYVGSVVVLYIWGVSLDVWS